MESTTVLGVGWTCPDCNTFVQVGQTHACPHQYGKTVVFTESPVIRYDTDILVRIEKKLDRIIELLKGE